MIQGRIQHNGGHFLMWLEPHVATMAKRIFTRFKDRKAGANLLTVPATPETAADLEMLMFRFKLDIEPATTAKISELSKSYHDRIAVLEKLTATDYVPRKYDTNIPLRDYQRLGADWIERSGYGILGDDIGLGKTATAIGAIATGEHLPAIVVTLTHLTKQWQRELQRFAPHLRSHIIKSGQPYELPTLRLNGRDCGPDVVILNYNKLINWGKPLGEYGNMAIYDECQELRRAMSGSREGGMEQFTGKYAGAMELSLGCGMAHGMSASPIYNYGGEIFNVYEALRPGCFGDWNEFAAEHCTNYDRSKASLKDPNGFGSYLRANFLMMRRTRKDVGRELGPCQRITIPIDADEKKIDEIRGRAGDLARFILGGAKGGRGDARQARADLENVVRQATGISKAPQVAEFVASLVEQGKKVILFGWHRAVYEIWMQKLEKYRPALYTGSESANQKDAARSRFMSGDSQVLIISLRSGVGLDGIQLVANSVNVIGELDWSPAVLVQCIGRKHRDGMVDDETLTYVMVSDSGIDPIMSEVLGLKDEQSDWLMNGAPSGVSQRVSDDLIARVARQFA